MGLGHFHLTPATSLHFIIKGWIRTNVRSLQKAIAPLLSYSCNLLRCALPVASMALDHQNTTHLVSFTFLLLDRYFGFPVPRKVRSPS